MELFKVMSVEQVKEILEKSFNYSLGMEEVSLEEAYGRIVGESIISKTDVPNFRRSTVDGYAVNSKAVAGASESMPSILTLKGEVLMGQEPKVQLDSQEQCIYVPTGGMIPEGSDSVVMIEYTEKLDEDTILINKPSANGEKVVQVGEDIAAGEVVINKGSRLRAYELGVLSSLGFSKVSVFKKPKIGVISTGDEIVGVEEIPKKGQVRDINTYILYSSILRDGCKPINYGVVRDNYHQLQNTMTAAIEECDIVLVSGGSSVGTKDQTMKVIQSFKDAEIFVHGISIKPGKPTILGKVNGKAVFGLPGHPLSCSIVYEIIVKALIDKIINSDEKQYPVNCTFGVNYHKSKGREEYLPVIIKEEEGGLLAEPIFSKSGLITGFSKAYGYIKIEKNLEGLREGEKVAVYKFF
ncbi:molybdopterin molybdotransferase MoeA [Clostridium sp. A1-XYC3]|uniref:Molybdopterin molybdenumtransferase n=1 Tax=Clostridium tanneri TaxID=3037988 RepID=A0ABU4JXF0_9CLOT|nr:molybdopterin molybdotransferase MoeA [Clostridium sp. A1-XYC3]MDW8802830.1 molybdopterin molybdotransferase MoeA [Clostridium sp. A1-XYC3]